MRKIKEKSYEEYYIKKRKELKYLEILEPYLYFIIAPFMLIGSVFLSVILEGTPFFHFVILIIGVVAWISILEIVPRIKDKMEYNIKYHLSDKYYKGKY